MRLAGRKDLAGLVICSGKPGSFIAGADLREFAASFDIPAEQTVAMCNRGRKLFQRLSNMPFVTVAAIDGICVGGGAELAIWCDRRILTADPKTQFGFPEVKLGLFPGWGGTVRASRIVGLGNAVELVTGGESIDAPCGDEDGPGQRRIVPADKLLDAAIRLVRAEQKSQEVPATIASVGAGRSKSTKPSLVFWARPRRPISSSRPKGTIRRRWRRWR